MAYALGRIDAQSNQVQSNDRAAGLSLADLGLVGYGLIEVMGAAVAVSSGESGGDTLVKAVGVQLVVLAAWLYSNNKQASPVKPSPVK